MLEPVSNWGSTGQSEPLKRFGLEINLTDEEFSADFGPESSELGVNSGNKMGALFAGEEYV